MAPRRTEKGFIMTLVLLVLAVLTIFGMAMMTLSTATIETTGNAKATQEALNIAYNRFQRAQQDLLAERCVLNYPGSTTGTNLLDPNGDGVDVADNVATSSVFCENVTSSTNYVIQQKLGLGELYIRGIMRSCLTPKIARDHFFIKATGQVGNAKKVVEGRVEYKSYLAYSFFQGGDLYLGENLTIGGEVYTGGDLYPKYGDVFKKDVYVKGVIKPATGIISTIQPVYEGRVFTGYPKTINLNVDAQIGHFFTEAQNCGWTIDATHGLACLGSGKIDSWTDGYMYGTPENATPNVNNLLDFSNFRNLDASDPLTETTKPPRYMCADGTTFYTLPDNFNGIIFWNVSDRDLHMKGLLGVTETDGVARGKSMVVIAQYTNLRVDSHVRTGTDSRNQPVNIAYIVNKDQKKLFFYSKAPILFQHQASFMITKTGGTTSSSIQPWNREGNYLATDGVTPSSTDSYRAFTATSSVDALCGVKTYTTTCSFDINNDGDATDTNAFGWNENLLVNGRTNILLQYGALIMPGLYGGAGVWLYSYPANGTNSTRLYHDDKDLLLYPPPFPKIKSLIQVVSYNEYDGE